MKAYHNEMNELRFTQQQKDEIADFLVLHAGETEKKRARTWRTHRTAAIAVAAAVCLTVTAFALPNSPLRKLASDAFAGILGANNLADSYGASLGLPVSTEGITITADAVIGDESNLCIVYSVAKDDGTPFETGGVPGRLMFKNDETFTQLSQLSGGGAHGSSYFTDSNPEDAAVQYVQAISVDGNAGSLRGNRLAVSLAELIYDDGSNENGQLLATGPWEFDIPLEYSDATMHLPTGQRVMLADEAFEIKNVAISPIGYRFELVSCNALPYDPKDTGTSVTSASMGGGVAILEDGTEVPLEGDGRDSRSQYYDAFIASLYLNDGQMVDFSYGGGGMSYTDDDHLIITKSGTFASILSLKEMQSLNICGADIALQP